MRDHTPLDSIRRVGTAHPTPVTTPSFVKLNIKLFNKLKIYWLDINQMSNTVIGLGKLCCLLKKPSIKLKSFENKHEKNFDIISY